MKKEMDVISSETNENNQQQTIEISKKELEQFKKQSELINELTKLLIPPIRKDFDGLTLEELKKLRENQSTILKLEEKIQRLEIDAKAKEHTSQQLQKEVDVKKVEIQELQTKFSDMRHSYLLLSSKQKGMKELEQKIEEKEQIITYLTEQNETLKKQNEELTIEKEETKVSKKNTASVYITYQTPSADKLITQGLSNITISEVTDEDQNKETETSRIENIDSVTLNPIQ